MKNPDITIIDSIKSNSIDIIADHSEAILDATLESGILKDIPIFGSLVKLTKLGNSVRDFLFTKKLMSFLTQVSEIDAQDRSKFIDKHLSNHKEREELGERLLTTIDTVDSSKKANYIGKAFHLYLQEEVSKNQFYDLVYSIENFKIHYTELFIETCLNMENDKKAKLEIIDHFFICGLLHSEKNKPVFIFNENEEQYSNDRLTDLGILFLEKIIEYDREELKSRFIQRIIDITPKRYEEKEKYEFVGSLSKQDLISELKKLPFFEILKFNRYNSWSSHHTLEKFNRIQRNFGTNQYDIFLRIRKE